MSTIAEVANYIATSTGFSLGGSTGSGTPVFMSKFPDGAAETAVVLLETGGAGPTYSYNGLAYERPAIQIICRSTSYATARNRASSIFGLLSVVDNADITKDGSAAVTRYLSITPLQSPTDMGQDAEERALITCNYMVEKELS